MGPEVPDNRFNIPMALTWARIAFIPLIVGVFYLPDSLFGPHLKNVSACVMFVLAAGRLHRPPVQHGDQYGRLP